MINRSVREGEKTLVSVLTSRVLYGRYFISAYFCIIEDTQETCTPHALGARFLLRTAKSQISNLTISKSGCRMPESHKPGIFDFGFIFYLKAT